MISSQTFFAFRVWLMPFMLCVIFNQSYAQQDKQQLILLGVAVILEPKPDLTLAFTIVNNSNQELAVEDAGVSSSPIIIIAPGGKEIMSRIIVERNTPLPTLKPGESRTTKGRANALLDYYALFQAGVYKLRWQAATFDENKKVVTYTSNEIQILRERGTFGIDPVTGDKVEIK